MRLVSICLIALSVGVTVLPDTRAANAASDESRSPPSPLQLQRVLAQTGSSYRPRTRHLLPDGRPRFTNRLILEDALYLLQHAHNPVEWYPWGEAAFAEARRSGKPILLSIGYSSCHWCHVMARESFDDPRTAASINRHFVAIKLDREQHPEVDRLYALAARLLQGQSGWPLTLVLTAEGHPIVSTTYLPNEPFTEFIDHVAQQWRDQRSALRKQAQAAQAKLREATELRGGTQAVDEAVLLAAERNLRARLDDLQGGFGETAKFPREPWLLFLQARVVLEGGIALVEPLDTTLTAMALGGIHDQAGGGFHRYAIDPGWDTPHFEKMLYNQAGLSRVYLRAWARNGSLLYRDTALRTLDATLRDFRNPEGAFHAAIDADSAGEEGIYYLWTLDQLRSALPGIDADWAADLLGVTAAGAFAGANVLRLTETPAAIAARTGATEQAVITRLNGIRERLRQEREQRRIPPARDDKVLLGWNGLMIATLAEAAVLAGDNRYRLAAERAADYLWRIHRAEDGSLWRVSRGGRTSVAAQLEDYAYFGQALVALYDATQELRWLSRSRALAEVMIEQFWDPKDGGFYSVSVESAKWVPMRVKSVHDETLASGNAAAFDLLQRLYRRSGEYRFRERAEATLASLSPGIAAAPDRFAATLLAVNEGQYGEVNARAYAAQGNLEATAEIIAWHGDSAELVIRLRLQPGWHVNAHQPLQAELMATEVQLGGTRPGWRMVAIDYPGAVERSLGFQSEPLALYEEEVLIRAQVERVGDPSPAVPALVPLHLRIQACNDRLCLQPERLLLYPSGAAAAYSAAPTVGLGDRERLSPR